jgi:hypothetical protein
MNYHLRIAGEAPMPPADADFAFKIDFQKGSGNPRRVFDAASELIDAFEFFDSILVTSIDAKMQPLMVLEDVDGGSIKVWLRNLLTRTDDEALKTLEWKPIIGRYLVKAKYILLEFCDDEHGKPSLSNLRDGLLRLAQETDVRHLPDYAPVNEKKLLTAVERVQGAKGELDRGDKLTVESEGKVYEVNLAADWTPEVKTMVEGGRESSSRGEIILTIRKPDFIKDTMWQFSHGRNTISAPILDEDWLAKFHNRLIPLSPGDALRCAAVFTYYYDEKGTLLEQKIEIERVLEVLRGEPPQESLV